MLMFCVYKIHTRTCSPLFHIRPTIHP